LIYRWNNLKLKDKNYLNKLILTLLFIAENNLTTKDEKYLRIAACLIVSTPTGAINWYVKWLKTVARSLTLIKKRILRKMRNKENVISKRKFTGSFYYQLVDGIRWNSLVLLIMYHNTIMTDYLAIAFRYFYYTR
jgi:thymidylate kinase